MSPNASHSFPSQENPKWVNMFSEPAANVRFFCLRTHRGLELLGVLVFKIPLLKREVGPAQGGVGGCCWNCAGWLRQDMSCCLWCEGSSFLTYAGPKAGCTVLDIIDIHSPLVPEQLMCFKALPLRHCQSLFYRQGNGAQRSKCLLSKGTWVTIFP